MRVLLMSMPDVTPHIAKREWEAPNLGIASIAGNIDRRHQVWIADLVTRLQRFPAPGETLTALDFQKFSGGKGANQAYAAGRLGGAVHMVGRVGNDGYGEWLVEQLRDGGVDTDHVSRDNNAPPRRRGAADPAWRVARDDEAFVVDARVGVRSVVQHGVDHAHQLVGGGKDPSRYPTLCGLND